MDKYFEFESDTKTFEVVSPPKKPPMIFISNWDADNAKRDDELQQEENVDNEVNSTPVEKSRVRIRAKIPTPPLTVPMSHKKEAVITMARKTGRMPKTADYLRETFSKKTEQGEITITESTLKENWAKKIMKDHVKGTITFFLLFLWVEFVLLEGLIHSQMNELTALLSPNLTSVIFAVEKGLHFGVLGVMATAMSILHNTGTAVILAWASGMTFARHFSVQRNTSNIRETVIENSNAIIAKQIDGSFKLLNVHRMDVSCPFLSIAFNKPNFAYVSAPNTYIVKEKKKLTVPESTSHVLVDSNGKVFKAGDIIDYDSLLEEVNSLFWFPSLKDVAKLSWTVATPSMEGFADFASTHIRAQPTNQDEGIFVKENLAPEQHLGEVKVPNKIHYFFRFNQ